MKVPSPRSLYQRALWNVALIAFAPIILLAIILVASKVLDMLGPWPYLILGAWILWAVVRFVAARVK